MLKSLLGAMVFASTDLTSLTNMPTNFFIKLAETCIFAALFGFLLWWNLKENKIEKDGYRETFRDFTTQISLLKDAVVHLDSKISSYGVTNESIEEDIGTIKVSLVKMETIINERLGRK